MNTAGADEAPASALVGAIADRRAFMSRISGSVAWRWSDARDSTTLPWAKPPLHPPVGDGFDRFPHDRPVDLGQPLR
jgi:hypothetical protein